MDAKARKTREPPSNARDGFVRVRGAREHNLKNVVVDIPRDALVVFTGVSGSGKSSLAFGTLYAEAQRRYLESVSPYARRLFHQMAVPEVDVVEGLPPAVALQQQRGSPTTRSSVGSVTTLSNLLRMLYSRAGDYPRRQPLLYAESFSPNTPEGACPNCHGIGRVHEVTERSMVPDDTSDHPRARGRRLADGLAGPEPPRHPGDARLRRRQAVARAAEEGPRLDPVHRRAADRAGLRRIHAGRDAEGAEAQGGAELPGHLHGRAQVRAADLRHDAERDDEAARGAVPVERGLPGLPGQAAQAGGACRSPSPDWISPRLSRLPLKRSGRLLAKPMVDRAETVADDHPEKALVVQRIVEDLSRAARGAARPRSRLSDA